MSAWEKVRLGGVADCALGKMLDHRKNHGKPLPYLANYNVRWGDFDLNEVLTMPFEELEIERYSVKYGDLLICEGGEIGRCALWKNQEKVIMYQKALHRVRTDNGRCLSEYLFYWFLNAGKTNFFRQFSSGATILHLPREKLINMEIDLPPLPIQQRIAAILSDYDAAIANCRRQIALLEEAAQRLYREMFLAEKSNGVTIDSILERYANGGWGKDAPTGKFVQKGFVIRGTDIVDISGGQLSGVPLRYHSDHDLKTKSLQTNDLILELSNGNINNIGRCLRVTENMLDGFATSVLCASFCKLLRPLNEVLSILLYWTIDAMQKDGRLKMFKNAGANGINNFDFDGFVSSTINVAIADEKKFSLLVILTKMIDSLRTQIRTLTEARDRLLPKLMSGEVAV